MIVILSWVSFWIDRTAAPARVTLGITTVLTMVTFIWSTNASLPKISYVKGIDVYLVCCFFMTFACVIEYGMVSFIHRRFEHQKRRLKAQKNDNLAHLKSNLAESVSSNTETCCSAHLFTHKNENLSPILWKKQINGEINASRYVNGLNINESHADLTESLAANLNNSLNNHHFHFNKRDGLCKVSHESR
jgi:hypothetical protein